MNKYIHPPHNSRQKYINLMLSAVLCLCGALGGILVLWLGSGNTLTEVDAHTLESWLQRGQVLNPIGFPSFWLQVSMMWFDINYAGLFAEFHAIVLVLFLLLCFRLTQWWKSLSTAVALALSLLLSWLPLVTIWVFLQIEPVAFDDVGPFLTMMLYPLAIVPWITVYLSWKKKTSVTLSTP